MKNNKQRIFTIVLFIVYLIALIWIVLFKLSFHFLELDCFRNINLILYVDSAITSEMVLNVIAFVPFGIYVSMIKQEWSFIKMIVPVFITSLLIEILQFIFMIRASDITDVIRNTLGGCIGIEVFCLFHKLIKNKTLKVLNIIAFVVTIIMIVLIAFLLVANI